MSSRETPIVCGVLIVVLIASAMADPPRNGEKVATPTTKPTTSRPSRLRNPDQMTAAEKRSAQSARYNLVKLKKIVQKKFLCQTCKGKGRLWVTLWAPARSGGLSHVDDENIVCDNCGGGKVFPSPGFHAALSEYNRAKLNFEQQYPLAEPLKTGLESWLFASIKNARTVAILNADAHSRLRAGAAKPDDIYSDRGAGLQCDAIQRSPRGSSISGAVIDRRERRGQPDHLLRGRSRALKAP